MNILSKITEGRSPRAQKVALYAPEGFGKSTLAGLFPDPLFLDVEESTAQMTVRRIGREDLPDLRRVEQALAAVAKEKPCGTLVVDTVDWLEQMVLESIIRDAASDKIRGIEDFGYGKGYVMLRERMALLLAQLDEVLRAGIHVVLLAHSRVARFEPPDGAGPYDRYEMKLTRQVSPLIKEWADMLLFGNWRTQIRERDGKPAGSPYKAAGGRERLLHCAHAAAWDAKNRHGLADVEPWDIATIRKAFASVGVPWGQETPTDTAQIQRQAEIPNAVTPALRQPAPAPEADPIPGLAPEEQPDAELDRICSSHAAEVNRYLLTRGHIGREQSYRSMPAGFRARVLKNPAAFLKAARGERRAA